MSQMLFPRFNFAYFLIYNYTIKLKLDQCTNMHDLMTSNICAISLIVLARCVRLYHVNFILNYMS